MKNSMSNKVRVGIWGLGRAGKGMHTAEIKVHSERVEVVAACDIDGKRAEAYEKENRVRVYTEPEKFLADKDMDLVAVCTRSPDHVRHTQMAMEAGFAAYIEKPLATSRAEAEILLALDRKYPGKLFCRQNRRFEPCFQHVKEIIESGILGTVHTIKLCRNNFSRRDDWQTLLCNGGGQLNNWGPHLIDHALQFLNYEAKLVWSNLSLVAALGDAEDCVKIVLQGKNGCIVDIEIFGGNALPDNVYEVFGDRGALVSSDEQDLKLRYIDPEYKLVKTPVNNGQPNGFQFADNAVLPWRRMTIMTEPKLKVNMNSSYGYIADSLLEGKPFPIKLQEALAVLDICDQVKAQSALYHQRG
ncbi:MAG: Gfo/Idh/MocA family oxidoreductase [Oligosphaeraceae bacterium]|nr:Gfo/Idh/MocA family oxidoreductase [Oligosphaeraceae bacterium]